MIRIMTITTITALSLIAAPAAADCITSIGQTTTTTAGPCAQRVGSIAPGTTTPGDVTVTTTTAVAPPPPMSPELQRAVDAAAAAGARTAAGIDLNALITQGASTCPELRKALAARDIDADTKALFRTQYSDECM